SSRRRHTRFSRDWSSDVCSSDLALFVVPFLPLPNPASWIYMLLSTVTQIFYMSLVAAAYKSGDMSEAYPIMRGTPPLLVALVSRSEERRVGKECRCRGRPCHYRT